MEIDRWVCAANARDSWAEMDMVTSMEEVGLCQLVLVLLRAEDNPNAHIRHQPNPSPLSDDVRSF